MGNRLAVRVSCDYTSIFFVSASLLVDDGLPGSYDSVSTLPPHRRALGNNSIAQRGRWEKMNSSEEEDTVHTEEIFTLFVTAINRHDIQTLAALMAPDHTFFDTLGGRVEGAASMESGWRGYFAMCPDYWIRTDNVMTEGSIVLAAGEAGGSVDNVAWQIPAAWKAVIRDGRLTEWRVFADNKPVYEILARR